MRSIIRDYGIDANLVYDFVVEGLAMEIGRLRFIKRQTWKAAQSGSGSLSSGCGVSCDLFCSLEAKALAELDLTCSFLDSLGSEEVLLPNKMSWWVDRVYKKKH
jgi:hypothetical protein